jgi:hypothetical protein
LKISSEKGVGTRVTICLKLMLKKYEKEVEEINNDIIKEEEYKMAQAIMNKQMLVIYKSSQDSDGDPKGKGDEYLSKENVADHEVPKKDGWGWEGKTYGQHSPLNNQRRSSGTYSLGQEMRNSKGSPREFVDPSRIASQDVPRNVQKENHPDESAPK